ncbi:hypothetical protein TFLX_02512 [Thermoflexales bacterium]|nr:hypothetical protein TFLX_02512 [Thermoflexales bacterium]
MNRKMILTLLMLSLLAGALAVIHTPAAAQTGGGYDLTWSTIDNGGGSATGGAYTLNGTIGQADAGTLIGNGYTLAGGYWSGSATMYHVYLPLVLK